MTEDAPAPNENNQVVPSTRTYVDAPSDIPEEKEAEFISDRVAMMVHAIQGNREKQILQEFQPFKTNHERFSYIWKMPAVHDIMKVEPEYNAKSSIEAAKHREKGNRYFQKKSYLSALSEYNESIIQAPEVSADTDEDVKENHLALAYGNRSAALLHLKRYCDALSDISLAMSSSYPQDSLYKLYDRQGKCYLALRDKQNATASFQKALENVTGSNLDERVITAWKTNLDNQLKACNDLEDAGNSEVLVESSDAQMMTKEPQEKYPNLSSAIEVNSNKDKGKHFIAAESIKVGDVLAVEKPYASVLFQAHQKLHCYNCMTRIDVPIPCTQCVNILYCSADCCQKAWEVYHKYECKFYALFDTLLVARIGHLALRMAMNAGLKFLLELQKNEINAETSGEKSEEESDSAGVYQSNYHNINKLETHMRDRFNIGNFNFTVASAFLTKILVACGFFELDGEDLSSTENITAIGSIVLKHLQIIHCNVLRIQEGVAGCRFDNPKYNTLGVAIYASVTLASHSCDPVADLNFQGNQVILRATRNIYEGEEVSISYGPVFYDTEYKDRMQQLNYCYFFTCECTACEESWPTVAKLADCPIAFRCEACRTPLDTSKNPYKRTHKCSLCNHVINVEEVIEKLQSSHDTFARGMEFAFTSRYADAIESFQRHLTLMQRYLCQPWRDFTSCQASLKHCYKLLDAQD